jgi:hypothetical protein
MQRLRPAEALNRRHAWSFALLERIVCQLGGSPPATGAGAAVFTK